MSTEYAQVTVRDNPERRRYELFVDDRLAGHLRYGKRTDSITLIHTEVLPELEGKGFGGQLVAGALEDIRAQGLRTVVVCPFVAAYLEQHPEAV